MENRPKIGTCIIIRKDHKILFGKRKGKLGTDLWATPGGHLEFGETWEENAHREVAEEVGIKIKNIQFATATNDIFPDGSKHYVTLILVCDYDSGEVQNLEPDKCEGWEWVDWHNLPRPLFLTEENLLKQNFDPFTL